MLDIIDKHLQCFSVDALDNIRLRCAEIKHPIQDLFLVHHVTRVDLPELVPVKRQRWQPRKIVLLLDTFVGDLDEVDVLLLALVVNVLEFLEDLLALLIALLVCKQSTIRNASIDSINSDVRLRLVYTINIQKKTTT